MSDTIDLVSKPKGILGRRRLSAGQWEELGHAVVALVHGYLERTLATDTERKVLGILDEVVEVDCSAAESGKVALHFRDHWALGACCGHHWYVLSLAAVWGDVVALFAKHGQRLGGARPEVASEYGPKATHVLAFEGDAVLAVDAHGHAMLSDGTNEDRSLAHDSDQLGPVLGPLAKDLYDSGLCRCSLCVALRPAKVKGKAAALRRPPETEPPWLAALQAAERGDVGKLDRLLAEGGYIDLDRCFAEGVKSPGAVTISHLLCRGHRPHADAVAAAARHDAVDALRLMLEAGADPAAHDSLGRSPLANAAMYGSLASLRLLLEAEVEVDGRDEDERTALLWAIGSENRQPAAVVRALLEAGADARARDRGGRGVTELLAYVEDEAQRAALADALGAS